MLDKAVAKAQTAPMGLTDILAQENIIQELQATDRWGAIDEMISTLVATGKIKPAERDCVVAVVKKRELSNTTGVGAGVAFPTAAIETIDEPVVAVGRSRKGIDFDSLDKRPVTLVMLVLVPSGQYQKYASIIQGLVKLFYSSPFRQEAEKAADAEAIYNLFREHEKDLVLVEQL